jgi:hypothetical protein
VYKIFDKLRKFSFTLFGNHWPTACFKKWEIAKSEFEDHALHD